MPNEHFRYLTLVPRGIEHPIRELLALKSNVENTKVLADPVMAFDELKAHFRVARANDEAKGRKRRRYQCLQETCCEGFPVGPLKPPDHKEDIMIGYDGTSSPTRNVWCEAGLMEGIVWMEFESSDNSASAVRDIGAEARCLGPLLATVCHFSNVEFAEGSVSLDQAVKSIERAFDKLSHSEYDNLFDRALRLWRLHVKECWMEENADELWKEEALKFRLSFVRSDCKDHEYTRAELLSSQVSQRVVPKRYQDAWDVDLEHYDLEIVIFQRDTDLLVGIDLRAYQYYGKNKSFKNGGLPADITPPLLPATAQEADLVRLRVATARTLLQLARVQPGDIFCDPCCGIGTLPYEASLMGAVALGGDLILNDPTMKSIAVEMYGTVNRNARPPNFISLDASCAPLRSSSIDVVVSDLPFGHKCLSSGSLNQLLPLVVSEAGRILRPNTGRMVLLCGSYIPVLETLQKQKGVWKLPCQSIFPMSIGGHVAWVVFVHRGSNSQMREDNYKEKVRKLTRKRDTMERQQKSLPSGTKKRRAQA